MSEIEYVKAALQVCESNTEREVFLRQWFNSPQGRHIDTDPFKRGAFARDANMAPKELGLWNRVFVGIG